MASFQIRLSKKSQGLAIRALILIIFIFASYFLVMRLISQLYHHRAMNHVREGYYLLAAEDLEKAIIRQGGIRKKMMEIEPIVSRTEIEEARQAQLDAAAMVKDDIVYIFEELNRVGLEGINLDTCCSWI